MYPGPDNVCASQNPEPCKNHNPPTAFLDSRRLAGMLLFATKPTVKGPFLSNLLDPNSFMQEFLQLAMSKSLERNEKSNERSEPTCGGTSMH